MQAGVDFWPAAGVAVAVGAGVGTVNAILVVVLTINPFIATLGTLSVFQGLAFAVTGGRTIVVDDPTLAYIGIGNLFGLPVPFIVFLIVFVIAVVFERFTRWGRTVYAIGGNAEAARLSGLHVRSTRAGPVHPVGTIRRRGGRPHPRTAVGGEPPGRRDVPAVGRDRGHPRWRQSGRWQGHGRRNAVAVAILGMLNNGFALLGSSSAAQQVALGVALIFAVLLEQVGRRLRRTER